MTIPCHLSRFYLFSIEKHDMDFGQVHVMAFPWHLLKKWWDFHRIWSHSQPNCRQNEMRKSLSHFSQGVHIYKCELTFFSFKNLPRIPWILTNKYFFRVIMPVFLTKLQKLTKELSKDWQNFQLFSATKTVMNWSKCSTLNHVWMLHFLYFVRMNVVTCTVSGYIKV